MVKLNKIYTRTGDGGTAGLVDGSRVSKSSLRMTAIGEVDEANAAIGVAISALGNGDVADRLLTIQNDMFDLGADVATPGEVDGALRVVGSQVERLEHEIDAMHAELPPLTSFILPSGSPGVAALHLARAVVRRAERAAVALNAAEPLNPHLLAYLNRLSDHLFVAARYVAARQGGDVLWQPGATRT
jgi:cob(I)alamin adenosyltransferase